MTTPTPADLHPVAAAALRTLTEVRILEVSAEISSPVTGGGLIPAQPADRIFDTVHTPGMHITPAQSRSRLLVEALNAVERLKTSLIALRTAPVDDLDLNLEAMYRHEERARRALDRFVIALAAGPAAPLAATRYRS